MDFIVDNYVWAIVIVVVVLMAIVGYIADKTDFGRKEFEKKMVSDKAKKVEKPKKEKKNKKKKEVVEELPVVGEVQTDEITNEDVAQKETPETDLLFDNLNGEDFIEGENVDSQEVEENIELENVNTFDLNEDTNMSFNDEVSTGEEEPIDQSLFEPLPSIDQVFSEPVSVSEEEVSTEESVDVPATDETTTQVSETESDDDIWKF